MRILLLAPHPFFQVRGTPLAEKALLEFLSDRGHEIDVVAFAEGEDLAIPRCRIHRVRMLPGVRDVRPGFSLKKVLGDVSMVFTCVGLMRKARYDVLHAVEESVFIAAFLGRVFGVPYVYDMDSSLAQQMVEKYPRLRRVQRLFDAAERLAIRRSAGVLAMCPAFAEVARTHAPDRPVACVEDVSLIPPPGRCGDAPAVRTSDGPVVMYVGNLEPYQGIDLLLAGFAEALRRVADATLVVIGGAPADVAAYEGRSRQLGIGSRVHFLGPRPVEQLAGYLRQADVLVSPRIWGSNTPMKIYSYLDSDRPVVATRLPMHTQVLDEEIAALVDPDPASLGQALAALLSDPARRRALAERARRRVREQYSPAAARAKLDAFFRQIEARVTRRLPTP